MSKRVAFEIAYATPDQQLLIQWQAAEGATIADVLRDEHLLAQYPLLAEVVATADVGIWSQLVADRAAYVLKTGDRLEIYRPLLLDPKEARRARADKLRREAQR